MMILLKRTTWEAGTGASRRSQLPATEEPDFVLRRRPGDFRRPSGKGSVSPQMACCCCCCLDILGACTGAWLGGMIAGGVAYSRTRRLHTSVRSYWWVVLWNFLVTLVLVGILVCMDNAGARGTGFFAIVLTAWTFLATPICCLIVDGRGSSKVAGVALLASIMGAVVGFAIGAAIMGGSVIFGGL